METIRTVWKRIQARVGGWDLPVMVLWAVTLFCIGPFVLLQVFSPKNRYGAIPVPIHSQSEADYSQDPRNRIVPVISLDILRDLMIGGEDLEEITFLQTLTATYRPPVELTPQPTKPLVPQVTPTPTATQPAPVDRTPTYYPTVPATFESTAPVRHTDIVPTDTPKQPTATPKPSQTTQVPTEPTTQAPPTTKAPSPTTPVTPKPSKTTEAPPTTKSPTTIVIPTKTTPPPDTPEPTNTPEPKPTNTPKPPAPTDPPGITPITFPTKIPSLPTP